MRTRSAAEYADFVLPLIGDRDRVLDVGCGPGSITVGLSQTAGHVIGVDLDEAEFTDARTYASEQDIENVDFREGSIYQLGFPDASFDVCTLFAMLETLEDPLVGLAEVRRVLKPGGLIGASSIEYGGLILHGPDEPLLRRSINCGCRSGRRRETCTTTGDGNSEVCCSRRDLRASRRS